MEKQWKQWQTLFSWAPKSLQVMTAAMKLGYLLLGRKAMTNLDSVLKSRDIPFLTKVSCQSYGVFISNVWMWELDYKESWEPKNWCFWTMVLEKTLESPLDSKEIKPVSPKENQPWIFVGRTDDEAEAPILWQSDVKSQLIGKDPDAGKEWRQEEKGTTGNEMVGWLHWLNGHEFKQALRDGEGQRSLVCCSPWGCKESDMTKRLNDNNVMVPSKPKSVIITAAMCWSL